MVVPAGRARQSSRPHAVAAAAAAAAGASDGLTREAEEMLLQVSRLVQACGWDECTAARAALPPASNVPQPALSFPQLFSVQAELPVVQAVAVAARTGCTARAALAFWKEQRDAWAQVMREAAQRAAAAAAVAAAAEGPAGGNGKAASAGAPPANQDVQGLIDALAAARAAATAKLRALQDASGEGLRDASVTGKCCEPGVCGGLLVQHCGTLRCALESTACQPPCCTACW